MKHQNRQSRTIHQLQILAGSFSIAFLFVHATFVPGDCAYAQRNASQPPKEESQQENSLVGRWQSDEATVEIYPNGTLTINREKFSYRITRKTIVVSGSNGSTSFPFQLDGDRLIVLVEGRRVIYTRINGDADDNRTPTTGKGANPPELVGKWCYMSNLTGTNSRMSNRCFTLNADGTYVYYAETSSSGSIASSASQESDSGRWSATETTITAYSDTHGEITYSLEKRNHPKNKRDPMLVLDGEAFVTAYSKDPW